MAKLKPGNSSYRWLRKTGQVKITRLHRDGGFAIGRAIKESDDSAGGVEAGNRATPAQHNGRQVAGTLRGRFHDVPNRLGRDSSQLASQFS